MRQGQHCFKLLNLFNSINHSPNQQFTNQLNQSLNYSTKITILATLMSNNIVVAIDGYSSCGKSTLAKALAKKLGFIYVDSGAMYRAVTLYFLRNNIDITDDAKVADALQHIELNFHSRDYESHITLNGEEVSDEIRLMPVSENVSEVSAHK